jgi:hypothetical protein
MALIMSGLTAPLWCYHRVIGIFAFGHAGVPGSAKVFGYSFLSCDIIPVFFFGAVDLSV